jgi:hypothetical protein
MAGVVNKLILGFESDRMKLCVYDLRVSHIIEDEGRFVLQQQSARDQKPQTSAEIFINECVLYQLVC